MNRPEQQLQRAVVDFLTVALPESLDGSAAWWFCPNGGNLSKAQRGVFKAMGLKAGQPDLEFVHNGLIYFIELKAPKGRTSDNQIWRRELLERAGCQVAECRSVPEVEGTLRRWGFPLRATVGTRA